MLFPALIEFCIGRLLLIAQHLSGLFVFRSSGILRKELCYQTFIIFYESFASGQSAEFMPMSSRVTIGQIRKKCNS